MTPRDWLEALVALVLFFTALAATDADAGADSFGVGQERTMNRYLTDGEQARLLSVLRQHSGDPLAARDYAWVRALRHSGLRIQEFSRITVGDAMAALKSGYLFVPKEHRKGWNRSERADGRRRKPPKDHQAYLTAALREALDDLLRLRLARGGAAGCADGDPLVASRNGGRMSVRNYQLRLAFWARKADLPAGVSPHWLRHTRAMNIMRNSTSRDPRGVVQRALGHADIRSSGIYTMTPREEVEAALDEVDKPVGRRVTAAALRRDYEGRASTCVI